MTTFLVSRNADKSLTLPPLRIKALPSTAAFMEAHVQNWVRDLAGRLGVVAPRIEWTDGSPARGWINRVCKSPMSEWAQLDRRAHCLYLNRRGLTELDSPNLFFIIAHMLSHLDKPEPEWVHDLRAMDVTGQSDMRLIPETAALIAHDSRCRALALQFKSGQSVIDYGFQVSDGAWDETGQDFTFRAGPRRRYPYED